MRVVELVDTSVFCNLLPVPGRDTDRDEVVNEFKQKQQEGITLILPVTTVIETGNFIAQVDDGRLRRTTAQKFELVMRLVIEGKAPWTLHAFTWGAEFLEKLLAGGGTQTTLVDHAIARVGTGDLCILTERQIYMERSELPHVGLWSRDAPLRAHN